MAVLQLGLETINIALFTDNSQAINLVMNHMETNDDNQKFADPQTLFLVSLLVMEDSDQLSKIMANSIVKSFR